MESLGLKEQIAEAKAALEARTDGFVPEVAIVLGSGLGSLAERIEDACYVPFGEVPYMGTSTATSHVGRFVLGYLQGKQVICMQGRLHGYEGYSPQEVAFPIWLAASIGAEVLITTNAAGAINEEYCVGDFCLMADQINFTGRNPVVGIEPNQLSSRFFSMYECFDPSLREIARCVAAQLSISLREGVYLGLLGPSFETAAEIRAFRKWGADTVAMSVCEEVIAARHVGMRVLGMSLVTNMACGVEGASPNDDEVLEVASRREEDFCALMYAIVKYL